jgi:hypothetical protein
MRQNVKHNNLFLHTSLLLLYIVGSTSRDYISRHKKLTEFTESDYDLLLKIILNAPSVLVTPNTLTETSNLAAYIAEPARSSIFSILKTVIQNTDEIYLRSSEAANSPDFIRVGLTDSTLMEVISKDGELLTTDLNLYLLAISKGRKAINFNHLRDAYIFN